MSIENCGMKAELVADGFDSEDSALQKFLDLTWELGGLAVGKHGKTRSGFGFIMTVECDGWKVGRRCIEGCLQKNLKRLGLDNSAEVEGACLHEPNQESQP